MDPPLASNEYLAACTSGRELYIRLDLLSLHRAPSPPDFEEFYSVNEDVVRLNAEENVRGTLASTGISVSNLQFVEVYSKKKKSREANPAYMNYFDGRNGVIAAAANFKDWDTTATDQRPWPSEVMWYSWVRVARQQGADVSGLRAFVRYFVTNKSTQRVIWEAFKHSSHTREGPERGRVEYTPQDQGFYALLGSVNGKSSMRMLLDHKGHIGYRTVEKVILVGDSDDKEQKLKLDEPEPRTFIILLSEKRQPPSKIPVLSRS